MVIPLLLDFCCRKLPFAVFCFKWDLLGTYLGLTWDSHAFECGRNRECNLSFRIALQRYCFSSTYGIVIPPLEQGLSRVTNVRMATILQFLQITERDLSLYKTPSQNLIYKYINLFFCLLHVRPSSLSSVRTVRLTMKVIILKSFNF